MIHGRPEKWVNHRRKKFTKDERNFVFRRDKYTCQICGKDLRDLPFERVLDHKIPLSNLGSNNMCNIWLLCSGCDKTKGSQILPELLKQRLNELQEHGSIIQKHY